jgi:hypothetical protein
MLNCPMPDLVESSRRRAVIHCMANSFDVG